MPNIRKIFTAVLLFSAVLACREVPVTGRRQLSFLPDSQVNAMALQAYNQFLTENKNNVLPSSNSQSLMIQRVGTRVQDAVIQHSQQAGYYDRIKDYHWEFHLVEDKTVNAWCMPGGKVVFYTGILPLTLNENGVAIVMGHEIAHAVAGHGGERMSTGLAAQGILTAAAVGDALAQRPSVLRQVALQAMGVGSQLGQLAFSRNQESEADKIGLIYAALAGFNPDEAVPFWQRMASQGGGQKPPELLSTHPSDERRIADLQMQIPEVKAKYYRPRN
jgi:predicted Zn-dependent protease